TEHAQGDDGQHEVSGEPEHAGGDAEDDDGAKERGADAPLEWIVGEENGGGESAHGGRGGGEAGGGGPRAPEVPGGSGQEGGGAAQQHREEVEGHGAEEDAPAPDEGNPREDTLEGDRLA